MFIIVYINNCSEADIVYNHVLDSAGRDREVARLLARQVASQWFSNLVSPTWWSDEWLNEGLTMFLGMDAINKVVFGINKIYTVSKNKSIDIIFINIFLKIRMIYF